MKKNIENTEKSLKNSENMLENTAKNAEKDAKNNKNIIEINDLVKIYNQGKLNEVKALNGLNFSVKRGETLAVMGVSGSGKSTLLHIIGCLDKLTDGEYLLEGKSVKNLSSEELAKIRNAKIGFVLQGYGLLTEDKVFENVKVPLMFGDKFAMKQIKPRVLEILAALKIDDLAKRKVRELSGGQRQRVAIARALVNEPEIILADEPTGALDSKTSAEIMDILAEINGKGKTVIIVTHDAAVAARCSRTVNIKDGVITE